MIRNALTLFFFILISCSNNESLPVEREYTYLVYVSSTCPFKTKVGHVVSKNVYESIDNQTTGNGPCVWITFKDINYTTQKGYSAGLVRVSK